MDSDVNEFINSPARGPLRFDRSLPQREAKGEAGEAKKERGTLRGVANPSSRCLEVDSLAGADESTEPLTTCTHDQTVFIITENLKAIPTCSHMIASSQGTTNDGLHNRR